MDFWLVQRLNRDPKHKGPITKLDHLGADYMGSAEFEFDAIPKAYKAMQAQKLTQTTVIVKAFNTEATFHVVAPADQSDSLQQRFQAWFDGGLRSKEDPYLDLVITRKGWRGEIMSDEDFEQLPIAWWVLRENIFFSTDYLVARMLLDAMGASEAALPEKDPVSVF
jgi:hypothetical protein